MSSSRKGLFEQYLTIVRTPTKGMAILAKRKITEQTTIEVPGVLWYIKNECDKNTQIDYVAEYEKFRIKHLANPQIVRDIHSLQSFRTSQTVPTQESLRKMFEVNGWEHRKGTFVAVATGSFFNHSCDPDCFAEIKFRSDKIFVTADKNISKGSEVSVSYLGTDKLRGSVDERQQELAPWHFYCECHRCKADQQELQNKALLGDAEAKMALKRLELLYNAAHPIVIEDDDDDAGAGSSTVIMPPDASQACIGVKHRKQSVVVFDDSDDHMEEDEEEQPSSSFASIREPGQGGGARKLDRPGSQHENARAQIAEQQARVVHGSSAKDWIVAPLNSCLLPPTSQMLPPMSSLPPLLSAPLPAAPPVVLPLGGADASVPFRFLTRAIVEDDARASAGIARVIPGVHLTSFALEEERTRLGLQLCRCRSGQLFKNCHQFLVRIPKFVAEAP